MLKFEDIFKRDDEEGKVLQADEFTRLEKKRQDSYFHIIIFFHFISITICNIMIEHVINSMMVIEYLVRSSSYFLHVCK